MIINWQKCFYKKCLYPFRETELLYNNGNLKPNYNPYDTYGTGVHLRSPSIWSKNTSREDYIPWKSWKFTGIRTDEHTPRPKTHDEAIHLSQLFFKRKDLDDYDVRNGLFAIARGAHSQIDHAFDRSLVRLYFNYTEVNFCLWVVRSSKISRKMLPKGGKWTNRELN